MASIILCDVTDCKHRSKRRNRKWHFVSPDGEKTPAYHCTLDHISLTEFYDPDGEIRQLFGDDHRPLQCRHFERKED